AFQVEDQRDGRARPLLDQPVDVDERTAKARRQGAADAALARTHRADQRQVGLGRHGCDGTRSAACTEACVTRPPPARPSASRRQRRRQAPVEPGAPAGYNGPMIRFTLVFLVLLLGLFTLCLLPPVERHFVLPFTAMLADICTGLVSLFDGNVLAQGNVM